MHSFLLRLRSEQLSRGELVGEVEDVRTGERQLVRRTSDLVDFCRRVVSSAATVVERTTDMEGQK